MNMLSGFRPFGFSQMGSNPFSSAFAGNGMAEAFSGAGEMGGMGGFFPQGEEGGMGGMNIGALLSGLMEGMEMGMGGMGGMGMGQGMGCPDMGMGGMGMGQGMGCPGMGGGGQGGGPITLQSGQTYTTPGGATINLQGTTLNVKDPGNGGGQGGQGNGSGSYALAGSGPNGAFAMAGTGGGGGCGQNNGGAQNDNFSVYGDPHITNPDGSQTNFDQGAQGAQNNGMFTLSDGTRIVAQAPAANQPISSVTIYPPGTALQGFNAGATTNWQNQGGKMVADGTVSQALGSNPFSSMMAMYG